MIWLCFLAWMVVGVIVAVRLHLRFTDLIVGDLGLIFVMALLWPIAAAELVADAVIARRTRRG